MKSWKAIVAVSENGVIGNGQEIPWRIPEDFRHFKATTMGGIVVMGRKTWESLGSKPLVGRENVVISGRVIGKEGVKSFRDLESFESAYCDDERQVWICGGAKLYESALDRCDEIVLSRVKRKVEGDIYFPSIEGRFIEDRKLYEHSEFDVILYKRVRDLRDM